MELKEKIGILAESAKYDVSCSSSGSERNAKKGQLGNASLPGICHSWSSDGRCISLLKILLTNDCVYDCIYCVNRRSADFKRAEFTPEELVSIVMNFYRRNYIEGLFISSAVKVSPDYTIERMLEVVKLLREREKFNGYIHMKGIPNASERLIHQAGLYVDRMSMNLEIPSEKTLKIIAPQKDKLEILKPMNFIRDKIVEYKEDYKYSRDKKLFIPAGQTTQFMIGATKDTDYDLIKESENLYQTKKMKRVYYSSYIPVVKDNPLLPTENNFAFLREHRLYQADWLLRFYKFKANEILNENHASLDLELDPKCAWAIRNFGKFPIEINRASYDELLRIPGVGVLSVRKIIAARRFSNLSFDTLKSMGIVLKRAKYFITCSGKYFGSDFDNPMTIRNNLLLSDPKAKKIDLNQISLTEKFPQLFQN
ncbi:MAG: putative DNA modification/repair radical SAM protein [Acidaminobacteraceae bacterium]